MADENAVRPTLEGRKILLGVTGSIAAYKAVFLTRLLVRSGASVKVLMTPAAARFVSPLTFATLSRHEVFTEVSSDSSWHNHVELGLWADAFVIAPLTATTLAKLASGLADNIIVAVYLSARCPVFFAPAMDLDMWRHPATHANVASLQAYGNHLIPVGKGELASGLVGEGRMAEPEIIVEHLDRFFSRSGDLAGKKVLLTAGPTHEPIDPVRFVGNRSTGKMGVALADAAARRGAEVILVLGPATARPAHPNVTTLPVITAREMSAAAREHFPHCAVAIWSAAVADYRPREVAEHKIKKTTDTLTFEMVKNPDIAAELGREKREDQLTVGFALETQQAEANARDKLNRKNLDLIVLNTLEDEGAGFGHDTNRVTIISRDNKARRFELKTKQQVAEDILDAVTDLLKKANHTKAKTGKA